MKIIKEGTTKNKPIRCKCRFCHTVFEFDTDEAQYMYDQRDGDAYKIACPICKKDAWVAASLAKNAAEDDEE